MKEKISKLIDDGLSYEEISNAIGVDLGYVRRFCYRNKLKSKKHGGVKYECPADFAAQIADLGEVATLKYFEKKYSVNTNTVKRWLYEAGLTIKKSNKSLEEEFGYNFLVEKISKCKTPNDANKLCEELQINKLRLEVFCRNHNIEFQHLSGKSLYIAPPKEELLNLISQRLTNRDVAEYYGVTNLVLKRWLNEYEITRQNGISFKNSLPNDFEAWYLATKPTYEDIKNKYGSTRTKILRWLKELGIEHEYSSAPVQIPPREELESLNDKAIGTYEIGLHYGVGQTLARNWLKHYDIPIKVTSGISKSELEVINFLNENGGNFISTKSVLENRYYQLDGYDSSLNMAFEYCGLFWHSDQQTPDSKRIHFEKYQQSKDKGIKLYTIFENEWLYKKSLVKAMLLVRMGKAKSKYYARKCVVSEISNRTARDFHDVNHISGSVNSSINIGLYYEGELISVMSLSKPRFGGNYDYEITRFSSKMGSVVIGGASKLFKYFITKHDGVDTVISFADLRWGSGDVYKSLGFEYEGYSPQNYFYFKLPDNNLHSRQKFQKHKLAKILENFDPSKTEKQNMIDHGWRTIHDCGNNKFVWKRG